MKIFIHFFILFSLIGCTTQARPMWEFYNIKENQFSVGLMAGTTYNQGFASTILVSQKISNSDFCGIGTLSFYNESIKGKILTFDVKTTIVGAGVAYSFFSALAPLPFNPSIGLLVCYVNENHTYKGDFKTTNNFWQPTTYVALEYLLSSNISLFGRGTFSYMPKSDFGTYKNTTELGIYFNF